MEEFFGCTGSCSTCGGCGPTNVESSPVLTLVDENGKETQFEKLDVVVLDDGKSFLIVSEITENITDDVEVVVLEIKEIDGETVYDSVTDKELQQKVYSKFLKQQGIEQKTEE